MPQALAMVYGLDWETEIRSFWSWYKDARDVIDEGAESSSLVRDLVAEQEQAIEEAASAERDPELARMVLRTAVAIVGLHYASNQKLLAALREHGVIQTPVPAPVEEAP